MAESFTDRIRNFIGRKPRDTSNAPPPLPIENGAGTAINLDGPLEVDQNYFRSVIGMGQEDFLGMVLSERNRLEKEREALKLALAELVKERKERESAGRVPPPSTFTIGSEDGSKEKAVKTDAVDPNGEDVDADSDDELSEETNEREGTESAHSSSGGENGDTLYDEAELVAESSDQHTLLEKHNFEFERIAGEGELAILAEHWKNRTIFEQRAFFERLEATKNVRARIGSINAELKALEDAVGQMPKPENAGTAPSEAPWAIPQYESFRIELLNKLLAKTHAAFFGTEPAPQVHQQPIHKEAETETTENEDGEAEEDASKETVTEEDKEPATVGPKDKPEESFRSEHDLRAKNATDSLAALARIQQNQAQREAIRTAWQTVNVKLFWHVLAFLLATLIVTLVYWGFISPLTPVALPIAVAIALLALLLPNVVFRKGSSQGPPPPTFPLGRGSTSGNQTTPPNAKDSYATEAIPEVPRFSIRNEIAVSAKEILGSIVVAFCLASIVLIVDIERTWDGYTILVFWAIFIATMLFRLALGNWISHIRKLLQASAELLNLHRKQNREIKKIDRKLRKAGLDGYSVTEHYQKAQELALKQIEAYGQKMRALTVDDEALALQRVERMEKAKYDAWKRYQAETAGLRQEIKRLEALLARLEMLYLTAMGSDKSDAQ